MEECVQLRKGVLGTEHPQTLSSAAALAELENIDLLVLCNLKYRATTYLVLIFDSLLVSQLSMK